MKKHIQNWLIYLIGFSFLQTQAQGYFDLRLPDDQITYTASSLPLSRIAIAGTSGNLSTNEMKGWVAILNENGNVVSQFHFEIPGSSVRFKFMEVGGNSIATIATEITNLQSYRTRSAVLKISLYQAENPSFLQIEYYGDSTDNIQLKGMYVNPLNAQTILYGTDNSTLDGIILTGNQKVVLDGPGQQTVHCLQPNPAGNWIALISEYESGALSSAVYLDANFAAVYSQPLPIGVFEPMNLQWRGDSVWYCMAAKRYCLDAPSGLRPKDIVIVKGLPDSGTTVLTCLGTINQNDLPGGMSFNFAQTEMLLSWTPAYRIFVPQSQGYGRNKIPVCRVDTTGQIVSQIEIGETAYYEIHQVNRTSHGSDGKTWLITGSRYDIWQAETGTDAFVIIYPESFPLETEIVDKKENNFSVYPNPVSLASNYLTINNPNQLEIHSAIYSLDGKLVQDNYTAEKIQTNKLPSGIYILRISTGEENEWVKIIVN